MTSLRDSEACIQLHDSVARIEDCLIQGAVHVTGFFSGPVFVRCEVGGVLITDGDPQGYRATESDPEGPISRFIECTITSSNVNSSNVDISEASARFEDCEIRGSPERSGVQLKRQAKGEFVRCNIGHNHLTGVQCLEQSECCLEACNIHNSATGCGVFVTTKSKCTIRKCNIYGHKRAGIMCKAGSSLDAQVCTLCMIISCLHDNSVCCS